MPIAATPLLTIAYGFVGGIAVAFLMPPFLRGVLLVLCRIGMAAEPISTSDNTEQVWGEDWLGILIVGLVVCLCDVLCRQTSAIDTTATGLIWGGMAAGSHVTWRIWNKRAGSVQT